MHVANIPDTPPKTKGLAGFQIALSEALGSTGLGAAAGAAGGAAGGAAAGAAGAAGADDMTFYAMHNT